jgi:glycosyltransferase involved in cell wall biosynthesis
MKEISTPLKLVIVMPVYNDWDSAKIVINRIDATLKDTFVHSQILLVDDGSSVPFPTDFIKSPLSSVSNIDLLYLRRNIGHQRAIAIALANIFQSHPCDAIVLMDADGEDRPEDILRLLDLFQKKGCRQIVFAERTKRMEGRLFTICYRCYQILHWLLTGHSVRVGNFSIIPFSCLSPMVVSPELWNHYAASVYNLRIPYSLLPAPRDKRILGKSKMNFTSLVIHGLSAISVFGETVGTRVLFAACGINAVLIFILIVVIMIRFSTNLAIPGWATYSSGLLLVVFLQILATAVSFLFFILSNRNMASFLPLRDYSLYIHETQRVFSRHE